MNPVIQRVIRNEGGIHNLYFADGFHTVAGICFEYNKKFFARWGIDDPEDIDSLPINARTNFYMGEFKKSGALDLRSERLQYAYFDHLINCGRSSAVKLLQKSLNVFSRDLSPLVIDGVWGPLTRGSSIVCQHENSPDHIAVVYEGFRREDYWKRYKKDNRHRALEFLHSWMSRVGQEV